ncbi:unnamed protein product, partial [marine sediment metagenome]
MLKIFEYSDRVNREGTLRAATPKWNFFKRQLDAGRISRTKFLDKAGTDVFIKTKRSFIERELKAGRDLSAKTAYLDEVVRRTQFWYETGQGPLIFRGQIKGGLLGVYGTWPVNYARLLKSWGENRAIMNFVRHAAAHYAFGSAFQAAGYDVWDWMFGDIRVAAGAFEGVPVVGKLFERGVPVIPFFGPLTRRLEGAIAAQMLASAWDIGVGFAGTEERQFMTGIWG